MNVDLLRHQQRWKDGLQELRMGFATLEAQVWSTVRSKWRQRRSTSFVYFITRPFSFKWYRQGFRSDDMQAWRQHWNHQLYKALEHQYQMGLEALNKNLPEIHIDLTFRSVNSHSVVQHFVSHFAFCIFSPLPVSFSFFFFTLVTLHMILHKYINLHFLTPSPHLHVHPLLPCQKARSFEVSSALWGGTSTLLQGNEEVHLHTEPVQRRQRSRGGAYLQHHDWQECLWVPHHLQESRGSL